MTSVNETLQDQIIHHSAVDLMKVETTQRAKVLKMMKELERDLMKDLVEFDPTDSPKTPVQIRRLKALLKQTKLTIKTHINNSDKALEKDLYDLAEAEAAFTEGAMNAAMGAEVASVAISDTRLKAMARRTLVEGEFPSEWWGKQSRSMQDKFAREMRKGMGRAETIGELSRRIRKNVMPVSRRNAEAMVRTSYMAVIQEARRESYAQMTDVIKGYKYVATLDSRTTPYCRAADGTVFSKAYKVVNGPKWVKPPPNHWQCRSTITPITKSWAELESSFKGTKTMDKLDPIPTKTRASMDGKAPRDITYTDWLKKQPKGLQKDILGPGRAALLRDGKITDMAHLLDQSGDLLTIQELKRRIASGDLVDPITGKVYVNSLSKRGKELAAMVKAEASAAQSEAEVASLISAEEKLLYDKNTVVEYRKDSDVPEDLFTPIKRPDKAPNDLWEPPWKETEKAKASGVILFDEASDKVFIVESKDHFGGYEHTFPKGRLKNGLTAKQSALGELYEESGMTGELLDFVGDYEKTVTTSRYYVGRMTKGRPTDFDHEIVGVKIVPRSKLKEYLNKDVDKGIADDFDALWAKALKEGDGDVVKGFKKLNLLKQKEYADIKIAEAKRVLKEEKAKAKAAEVARKKEEARMKREEAKAIKTIDLWAAEHPPLDTEAAYTFAAMEAGLGDVPALMKMTAPRRLHWLRKGYESVAATKRITYFESDKFLKRTFTTFGEETPGWNTFTPAKKIRLYDNGYFPVRMALMDMDDIISTKIGKRAFDDLTSSDPSFIAGDTIATRLAKVKHKISELEASDIVEAAAKKAKKTLSAEAKRIVASAKTAKAPVKRYDMDSLEKYASQEGSNPGGYYKDKKGNRYYVKFMSKERVNNEVLAARLYRAMGEDVPDLGVVKTKDSHGIVSPIIDGLEKNKRKLLSGDIDKGIEDAFITDAWLANWDVVGAGYDNLLVSGRKAVRIDVGGALNFRAQGARKTWGNDVGALFSLRDTTLNPTAGNVFKNVTDADMIRGARKLEALAEKDIKIIVNRIGGSGSDMDELATKLIARRKYILEQVLPAKPVTVELPARLPSIKPMYLTKLEKYLVDFDEVTIGKKSYTTKKAVSEKVRAAIRKLRYAELGKGKLSVQNKEALKLLTDEGRAILDADIEVLKVKYGAKTAGNTTKDIEVLKVKYGAKTAGNTTKDIDVGPTGSGTGIARGTSNDAWSGDLTPTQDAAYKSVAERTRLTEADYEKFAREGFNRKDTDDLSDMIYEAVEVHRSNFIGEEHDVVFNSMMSEGVFKNQFVLGKKATSEGTLSARKDRNSRNAWEKLLFNNKFHEDSRYKMLREGDFLNHDGPLGQTGVGDAYAKERPDYGWLFDPGKYRAASYGDVSFVMKEEVKDRVIFTLGNSSGLREDRYTESVGTIRHNKNLIRSMMTDKIKTKNLLRKYQAGIPVDEYKDEINRAIYGSSDWYGYAETQIIGGINFARDLKEIRVSSRYLASDKGRVLRRITEKWNIPLISDDRIDAQ